MIIFDSDSYQKLENLRKKLTSKKFKIEVVSNFYSEKKIKKAVLVVGLEKSFFDTETFEFLKNQNYIEELNIIFILKKNQFDHLQNASVAANWVRELVDSHGCKYRTIAEVSDSDENYLYEIIYSIFKPNSKPKENDVVIYTDGACSGNPGAGGWAAVLISKNNSKEISGGELETTNNRMELMAVIKALEMLKKPCNVTLYSDSAYVVNAFQQNWIDQWKQNNWKNSEKVIVKNVDLWQKLDSLVNLHNVNFCKVKGHSDDKYNNLCDKLAVAESKKLISNEE